jgi:hypothetical protein
LKEVAVLCERRAKPLLSTKGKEILAPVKNCKLCPDGHYQTVSGARTAIMMGIAACGVVRSLCRYGSVLLLSSGLCNLTHRNKCRLSVKQMLQSLARRTTYRFVCSRSDSRLIAQAFMRTGRYSYSYYYPRYLLYAGYLHLYSWDKPCP